MYSLPTSETFAAFTMASAASTEPLSPIVSIIPSASCCGTRSPFGRNCNTRLIGRLIARVQKIAYAFKTASKHANRQGQTLAGRPPKGIPTHEEPRPTALVPHLPCRRSWAVQWMWETGGHDAAGGDTEPRAEPRPRAGGEPARIDLQVRRAQRRAFSRGLPRVRARRRHRRRADVDRRSQPAGADVAVEARTDRRILAHDLRAGVSLRRRRHGANGAALDEGSEAGDAQRRRCRSARL